MSDVINGEEQSVCVYELWIEFSLKANQVFQEG